MSASVSLYLASQSPRRRELLDQIGVSYKVVSIDVEECAAPSELPLAYVCRLAADKAAAGVVQTAGNIPVLGSDTVVVCDDLLLEKPQSREHAVAMLQQLSGRGHQVITAVCVANTERSETLYSLTEVEFRGISVAEAESYWESGEPADKAGGYAIQGLGAVFVKKMSGSYTGVVGLPLYETQLLLNRFNVPMWQRN
ncbi:Maf family protein [Teredinibacter waterburyi]|uniref:Maf family protein n=1 Tax=Teredinibacter waterburyi TaxID=1500538 RepID=UPI00165FF19E|nr:Maf family protein [Teredinibacter waterburyi]